MQMEFQQRVETIWGPVETWESVLDLRSKGIGREFYRSNK